MTATGTAVHLERTIPAPPSAVDGFAELPAVAADVEDGWTGTLGRLADVVAGARG